MNIEEQIKDIVREYLYELLTQVTIDKLKNSLDTKLQEYFDEGLVDNKLVSNISIKEDGTLDIWFSVERIRMVFEYNEEEDEE